MTIISGPLDPAGAAAFTAPEPDDGYRGDAADALTAGGDFGVPVEPVDAGRCDWCHRPAVIAVWTEPDPCRACEGHEDEFNEWLWSRASKRVNSPTPVIVWPPEVLAELASHAGRHADTTPPA